MLLLSQITTIGIIATLVMTGFSYCISYFSKSKFEEPQLLNTLLDKLPAIKQSFDKEHIIGWALHLGIGMCFAASYKILYEISLLDTTLLSGGIFGFLAGLLGVSFWMGVLNSHPNPPKIDRKTYYLQLIFAHVLFGISTAILFKEFIK